MKYVKLTPILFSFIIISHVAGILPLATFGIWANYLIPSFSWLWMTPHLMLMAILTALSVNVRWLIAVPILAFLLSVLINIQGIKIIMQDNGGNTLSAMAGFLPTAIYALISSVLFIFLTSKLELISNRVYKET